MAKNKWKKGANDNWKNDSILQAKSGGQPFMSDGKNWLDYYNQEKDRRQKEAAQNAQDGKINYKEAVKTSRVHYTLPQYQGTSKDTSYPWEKDVRSLKYKGLRSNNDKFDAFAKQMGMTDGEAEDFRRFLDFQTDSTSKGPKIKKDGSVDNRSSVKLGQGANLQTTVMDQILGNLKTKSQQIADNAAYTSDERAARAAALDKKSQELANERIKNENYNKRPQNSFLDDLMQNAKAALGVATNLKSPEQAAIDVAKGYVENGTRPNDKTQELSRGITRTANTAGFGAVEQLTKNDPYYANQVFNNRKGGGKAADFIYDSLGYALPGSAVYKGIEATKLGKALGEAGVKGIGAKGALAGLLSSLPEVGLREAINPNDTNWKDNALTLGTNTLLGGTLDAGAHGIGKLIQSLKGKSAPEVAKVIENLQPEEKASVDAYFKDPTNVKINNWQDKAYGTTKTGEPVPAVPKDANVNEGQSVSPEPNTAIQKEYEDAVQKQYDYLKSSMGKGVDTGTTSNGLDGNFKEVTGRYTVSKNPKWYQDFYAVNKRKPNQKELRQLAEEQVKNGFQDDFGSLPAWGTNKVQELDNQINEVLSLINDNPDKEQVLKPILDALQEDRTAATKLTPEPKVIQSNPSNDTVTPEKPFDPLVKLNLQKHNTVADTNPIVDVKGPAQTKTAIESVKNPIKRKIDKFYEGYVNRNHSFKVAEMQTLASELKRAKEAGNTSYAKEVAAKLKNVKRYGSDLEKAVGNEQASSSAAKNFLDRHLSSLSATVGGKTEEVSKALEYQMALNLDWIKKNSNPEYQLPDGWDWGRVTDIINQGNQKEEYKAFTQEVRNFTQDWRDVMLDYGLIDKASYDALSKNPYYIPMARELNLDNIDSGIKGNAQSARRRSGTGILHDLHSGDVETFYKNPLETMMKNTFVLYKNAYRNDTAQQALKLAQLDTDGMFAKEISHKQFLEGGGLEISVGGKKQYVRLQKDLMDALKENEQPIEMDNLLKITRLFSALKTRSLEYQVTAAPRDLTQAYVTSQIGNPLRYFGEVLKAVKNKNADAKKVGAYFENAYNAHTSGMDHVKITQEYAKQSGMKVVNPKDKKSLSDLGRAIDKLFAPSKWLGQVTDDIPRDIEVRETERLFMKKHGQEIDSLNGELFDINQKLDKAAQSQDPFDPILQGIDNLKARKTEIEGQLQQFQQDLKREQVYRGRDVMNYQRAGRGGVAKAIRKYIVFANTTTQSKDKVIRSFMERPVQTILKSATVMAPFIAAEKIMHEQMSDSDRKVYDGIPDYLKQFNYVYVVDGKVVALPKLQELALISNPIEAALKGESLNDSMQLLAKETIPYQLGNFAQGFVPNKDGSITPTQNMQIPAFVGSPAVDAVANKKLGFNQKPISFGQYFKGADGGSNDWTLDFYKKLFGDTPGADKAQYLTEQYGGDAGKYLEYLVNLGTDPTSEDKLNTAFKYLNPFQDRYYDKESRFFKSPPKESRK